MNPEKFGISNQAESKTEKNLKVTFIDTTENVKDSARDMADAKMTAEKRSLEGIGGFFKKMWKHNLFHEYYRQKAFSESSKNLHDDKNFHENMNVDVTNQFISEYEGAVHRDAGEKKDSLGNTEKEKSIENNIKELIRDYARGSISDDVFVEEQNRVFSQIKDARKDIIDKGVSYSSNLLEVAKQVKQNIEHGEGLNALDLDMEVIVGKAKGNVRTEAQFNTVDRVIEKIQSNKVGRFFNEATVTSAVAISYCLGAKLSQSIASSKLLAWGSFGMSALLGGGIAAARESKRLEEERRQHFREMAQGKKFEENKDPRRKEMEEFRYETKDANNLADNLNHGIYRFNEQGEAELKKLNQEEFQLAVSDLAEIESRIKMSDQQRIDLISYSDSANISKERLNLDIMRAKAKIDLEKIIQQGNVSVPDGKTFQEFLDSITEAKKLNFAGGDSGIAKKNELFGKMKKKKVMGAALKGVATGLVIGGTMQEIGAFMRDGQEGFLENMLSPTSANASEELTQAVPDAHSFTPLEYMRRVIMGEIPPNLSMDDAHKVLIGSNSITLPKGVDLISNPDGTYNLMRGNDVISEHLKFNPDGTLSADALKNLADNHVGVNSGNMKIGPKNILAMDESLTKKINRNLWYDNDTPKPVFDKNELKLFWGGKYGTGIDANGNYVFDAKHMMPGGSFHKNFSVDAQDAISHGKLKMLFSLSKDTQNQVFEVPIDVNGNAIIDPESEIGKLFFTNEGGHAVFNGKYAEVAEIMGDKNGIDQVRVLATHVGKGIAESNSPVSIFNVPSDHEIDPPIFISTPWRTPLEPTKNKTDYLRGYFSSDPANKQFYRERRSASLENPNVKLNHERETREYLRKQPVERRNKTTELASQVIEPMNDNCEVVFCIPIAGHQEGKNIYQTLDWYKNQENNEGKIIDPEKFEILAMVNHPKDTTPDETMDEIKRFKKDNPRLCVRVVYETFDRSEATIGNMRKYATDIALMRNLARGSKSKDLIIASNDADCKGMSKKYIQNFIDKFRDNPRIDAVLGKIDWEPEAYVKMPILHIGIRLFQYLDIVHRHHKNAERKSVGSSGANFAFKGSMYAAVGGYNEHDTKCEDVVLGEMIKYGRNGSQTYPIQFGNEKSLVYTNARRAVNAVENGLAPAEMWSGGFSPDDELRKSGWKIENAGDIEKLLKDPAYLEKLRSGIEIMINRTLENAYRTPANSWEARRAIGFLGIKYVVSGNRIKVTDISKVVAGLKKYQKDGMDTFRRKIS